MSSATVVTIEKLKDGNYEQWRKAVWAILLGEQYHLHLTGSTSASDFGSPEEFHRAQEKCLSLLVRTIDYSQFNLVRESDTPQKLWKRLEENFRPRGFGTRFQMRRIFFNLRMSGSMTMTSWISHVEVYADRLVALGSTVPDEDIMLVLVNGLPESYSTFVISLDNMADNQLTLAYVKRRLINEHMRQQGMSEVPSEDAPERERDEARAMASHFSRRGGAPSSSGRRRPATRPSSSSARGQKETECFRCGKSGHVAADCRLILEGDYYDDDAPTPGKAGFALTFGSEDDLTIEEVHASETHAY